MNVAVIGARGIGKYHIREYMKRGVDVVSILGKTKESLELVASELNREFGARVRPYHDLEEMLQKEEIDAVSICTLPNTHEYFIKRCLQKQLHILCEKPFIVRQKYDLYQESKNLLNIAKSKGSILTVNTQWPSVLENFGNRIKLPLERLDIYMESGSRGREMLWDHMPHANSILTNLIKNGVLKNPHVNLNDEKVSLSFDYVPRDGKKCSVNYRFKHNPQRPREIEFTFNGNKFARKLNKDYQQNFINGEEEIPIPDPLGESIYRFIESAENKKKSPLISEEEILDSAKITDAVLQKYDKV